MLRSSSLLLLALVACARQLPMPMTASALAEERSGDALVTYLGQRDASAAVCDLRATGPHLAAANADVRDALMSGLRDGRIAPELWRDCVTRLVPSADRESAASLLDAVARSYDATLSGGLAEYSPSVARVLSVMQSVLMDRRGVGAPHASVMTEVLDDLRGAIAEERLGPLELRYATDLIADVELERGVRAGRPVDLAVLDQLLQSGDEAALRQLALRLPDAALRADAHRRVIRLHIRGSQDPQVREHAAVVEETLMRVGANPVTLTEHRALRASADGSLLAARGVLVRQDLDRQTSTLLGVAGEGSGVSVLPRIPLRGAIQFELEGIDHPLALCAPAEELDVSPCVSAADVTLDSRFVSLEGDGTLRFFDRLAPDDAAALANSARRLVVPIIVDGRRLAALDWDLQFETPKDLVPDTRGRAGAGPDLRVRVEALNTGRLSYAVSDGRREYQAIIERPQAGAFHVISRGEDGGVGSDGASGRDGLTGLMGNNASCPATDGTNGGFGWNGTAGEDGGTGRPGGRGGDVVVEVAPRVGSADELLAVLRGAILSRGGSGGAGGSGGRGGRGGTGGSGGQGATCIDSHGKVSTLSGGAPGLSGSDGRSGVSGSTGAEGRAGTITVRVVE